MNYAECCYAECHYAECRYAQCRGTFSFTTFKTLLNYLQPIQRTIIFLFLFRTSPFRETSRLPSNFRLSGISKMKINIEVECTFRVRLHLQTFKVKMPETATVAVFTLATLGDTHRQ